MQFSQTGSESEMVGPYELLDRLAVGELGVIYVARLQGAAAADRVALKLLHLGQIHDRERREALRREAAISAMATPHGRVLAYVDDVRPYLVMRLIEGASLSHLLTRSRARGVDGTRYATTILIQALTELQTFHDGTWSQLGAPLVHQAPCARHILVGADGSTRLTDFTMALCPSLPPRPIGEQRLRPFEMSPEQALAPAHVGAGCDLFILGISLWEALSGKSLFAASSAQAAMDKMLRDPIPPPSEAGAVCHRSLDRVCARALARTRVERYASAAEMAADLRSEALRAGLLAEQQEIAAWVAGTLASAAPGFNPWGHESAVRAQVTVASDVMPARSLPDERESPGEAAPQRAKSDGLAALEERRDSTAASATEETNEALARRAAAAPAHDDLMSSARAQFDGDMVGSGRAEQGVPGRTAHSSYASNPHVRRSPLAPSVPPRGRSRRYLLPVAAVAAVGLFLRSASLGFEESESPSPVHAQSPVALEMAEAPSLAKDLRPPLAVARRNVPAQRDSEPAMGSVEARASDAVLTPLPGERLSVRPGVRPEMSAAQPAGPTAQRTGPTLPPAVRAAPPGLPTLPPAVPTAPSGLPTVPPAVPNAPPAVPTVQAMAPTMGSAMPTAQPPRPAGPAGQKIPPVIPDNPY